MYIAPSSDQLRVIEETEVPDQPDRLSDHGIVY